MIGHIIKAARRQAKLSQKELALRLGTSQGCISRWERNGVSPQVNTLLKIAEALGDKSLFKIHWNNANHELQKEEAQRIS